MGAVVALLLVAAVLVVLARVRLWQQAIVSDRVIRFFAWALKVFLLETVAAFTWSRGDSVVAVRPSLVLGLLALVVAGSGGAWRIHRTLPSHWREPDSSFARGECRRVVGRLAGGFCVDE